MSLRASIIAGGNVATVPGMCRLFGMSGAPRLVRATFWLLEAPDSLAEQSRREPDGTGLGTFDGDGQPVVAKQPIAAYRGPASSPVRPARSARGRSSPTSATPRPAGSRPQNTHPFEQDGRLFAHNGVIGGLDRLDAELGSTAALVSGDTDSERFFALITREIGRADGDVGAGITAAARVGRARAAGVRAQPRADHRRRAVGAALPRHARALRPRALRRRARAAAATSTTPAPGARSASDRASSPTPPPSSSPPSGWTRIPGGACSSRASCCTSMPTAPSTHRIALPDAPAHRLALADLDPRAAASQRAGAHRHEPDEPHLPQRQRLRGGDARALRSPLPGAA